MYGLVIGLSVAAALLLPLEVYGQQKGPSSWLKENQAFLQMDDTAKALYAMGFLDGFISSAVMSGAPVNPKVKVFLGCMDGMNNGQRAAIIEEYVRRHPDAWHREPLGTLAWQALSENCPGL